MIKRAASLTALIVLVAALSAARPETRLSVELGPPLEIGRADLLFGSIVSVCEDDEGDFYVLDRLERTVLKFSPEGRLLLKFGRKGQGPGDFQSPGRIAFVGRGELAVLEDVGSVSFHRADGAFVRRLDLHGRLGLGYVGPDRYYGWEWRPDSQQQLLVDADNAVRETFHAIGRDLFSAVLPDETGRSIMFNYDHEAYVPQFLFAYGAGLSAVGMSDRYEIALLDEQGRPVTAIRRDLEPVRLTSKEKAFLERGLREFSRSKSWPDRVVRELAAKIPAQKNIISSVLISPDRVYVFRFPPDLTAASPRPVDVFARDGAFLGSVEIPAEPLFISAAAMYFVRTGQDGNVYLDRRSYSIRP